MGMVIGEWQHCSIAWVLQGLTVLCCDIKEIVEMVTAGEQPDDGDEQRGRLPALNSPSGGHHSQERLGNQVPRSGQSSVSLLRALKP